jgi:hypothetical protein
LEGAEGAVRAVGAGRGWTSGLTPSFRPEASFAGWNAGIHSVNAHLRGSRNFTERIPALRFAAAGMTFLIKLLYYFELFGSELFAE